MGLVIGTTGLHIGGGSASSRFLGDQWYGVKGNYSSYDPILTRVGCLDLHRTLPIHNKMRRFVENPDGTVKYYLDQNDSRKKVSGEVATLDSTDGNVMLEIPEHYFRFDVTGTEWTFAISEYPIPGFVKISRKTISPWLATVDNVNNKVVSGSFLTWDGDNIARDENNLPVFTTNAAQFRGGGNNASRDGAVNSDLGMGRTSISRATMRSKCVNGTHVGCFRAYNTIKWFQRIEYANMNCQANYNPTLTEEGFRQGGLGNGTAFSSGDWNAHNGYNPFIPSGVTATLGNNTGLVSYVLQLASGTKTFQVQSYRGFEVPFEYIWHNADDVLIKHNGATESVAYLCTDPTKFASPASDTQANPPEGYVAKTNIPITSCNPKHEATDGDTEASFPVVPGGSSTTGICDYFYHPGASANGWYAALFGGYATNGALAGFGCLDTTARPAHTLARLGFRLCRN